jgi:hypothetical protein
MIASVVTRSTQRRRTLTSSRVEGDGACGLNQAYSSCSLQSVAMFVSGAAGQLDDQGLIPGIDRGFYFRHFSQIETGTY